MSSDAIKVIVRFRPQSSLEIANEGRPIVHIEDGQTVHLEGRDGHGTFTFDKVFDGVARQVNIFEDFVKDIVADVLQGYNGTVIAYGQTGSGKTFTMMGPDIDNSEDKGIIPRIIEQIFASILSSPSNLEYLVKVSFMEIYMERIRDLLNPDHNNLQIHEDRARGVFVKGLSDYYVSNLPEVFNILRLGNNARKSASTNMNVESSRSHSIFVITLQQKDINSGITKNGNLYLVDLAGSEKVGKTGASGQTLEEAKKINKSLSSLGNVINALTDAKSSHVPYRDSKLTRILQESLGGNSRTTLIVNASSSSYNEAETVSALRFGVRAKSITNIVKVNSELSQSELKNMLRKARADSEVQQKYIMDLNAELSIWRTGGTVDEKDWATTPSTDIPSSCVASPRSSKDVLTHSRSQTPVSSVATVPGVDDELLGLDKLSDNEADNADSVTSIGKLRNKIDELTDIKNELFLQNSRLTSDFEQAMIELRNSDEKATTKQSFPSKNDNAEKQSRIQAMVTELEVAAYQENEGKHLRETCERLIDLELQLQDCKKENASLLRQRLDKKDHQKMSYLERNLEYLHTIYQKLVLQNMSLKKDNQIASAKLSKYKQRIGSLEESVFELQDNFQRQRNRYDDQLRTLQAKYEVNTEDAMSSTLSSNQTSSSLLGMILQSGRVAKPLRGYGQQNSDGRTNDSENGANSTWPAVRSPPRWFRGSTAA